QLVLQQSNMAAMLMGKAAHPETGEITRDIEAAKLFIDQLEMLEAKTKGNLSKEEDGLLKQTLMALRMAFVEAVESGPESPPKAEARQPEPAAPSQPATSAGAAASSAPSEEEPRKQFRKKYEARRR